MLYSGIQSYVSEVLLWYISTWEESVWKYWVKSTSAVRPVLLQALLSRIL